MKPLEHFFNEVWHRHYSAWCAMPTSKTLYDEYSEKFGLDTKLQKDPDRSLYRMIARIEPELPDPIDWLRRHKHDSRIAGAKEAIVHGDLHGDNLFVNQQYAWAIDFERTGPSHALRDFAELEIDILTRLLSVENAATFQTNFVALLQTIMRVDLLSSGSAASVQRAALLAMGAEFGKAAATIFELRQIAQKTVSYRDGHEYLWSLLFDAVFASYMEHAKAQQRERAFLVAAVICDKLRGA